MRYIVPLVTTFAFSAAPVAALAQGGGERLGTIVGSHPAIGGYFGLDMNIGQIRSATGIFAGADIAVIFAHRLSVGVAGYGLANGDARVTSTGGVTDTIRFGYGGLRVGYVFSPAARLHPSVDLLIAGGSAQTAGASDRSDEVFVAEPSVIAEANLTTYLRAALGVGYRFVGGVDLPGVTDSDLRGVSARLTLRAGRF